MTGITLTWRAVYRDGTVVEQYDEKRNPVEVSYRTSMILIFLDSRGCGHECHDDRNK